MGPDGKPQWTPIDLPTPPPVPVEPTYHTMEGHAMGDDLKAGGRYRVDEDGNVSEGEEEIQEPLTETEKTRARAVFPTVDMDRSGVWEQDEVVALYKAGDSRAMFGAMDRRPRDGQVTEDELIAYLPKLKPLRGTKSLKFTLRHLEKNVKLLQQDVTAAQSLSLHMQHYTPEGNEAMDPGTDPSRLATYQIIIAHKDQEDASAAKNLYVDVVLPKGAQVTQRFYYLEGNVRYGEAPTRQCSFMPNQKGSLRCKIEKLESVITLYVHATYPEDAYDEEELDEMRSKGLQVTAALLVAGNVVHTASTPIMETAKREL